MERRRVLTAGVLMSTALFINACNRAGTEDDKAITDGIQAKLYRDPILKTRDISIIADRGVVVLSGQVNSAVEKSSAERVAMGESGVKQVINQLTVVGPPKPVVVTIPFGTVMTVQMIDSVDSKTSPPGGEFAARLTAPLVVGEKVVFSEGSDARVRLESAKQAGHMKGSSELQLQLVSLTRKGKTCTVQTNFSQAKGDSRGKQTGRRMAGGGDIEGIAGGGKGAGAGGAALVQAVTKGKEVKVPSETRLDFKLSAPLEVEL